MSRSKNRSRERTLFTSVRRFVWRTLALTIVVSAVVVLSLRWVNPPTSAFIVRAQVTEQVLTQRWVNWKDISPLLAIAVIAAEDQKFPFHWGLDLGEIQNALSQRINRGKLRGASTITQQLAKNLFLWPGRSLWRKAIEAYFALLIETLLSKQRILELYLNLVEFGPGAFGVGVASHEYLAVDPSVLTLYDASLMAAVLPNPKELMLSTPSAYVNKRASDIRKQVRALGGVSYLRSFK